MDLRDSRRMGGSWTLDLLWERLGIRVAIRVAARRLLFGEAVELVISPWSPSVRWSLAASLPATGWVSRRVAVEAGAGFTYHQAYRRMDFLLEALDEIAADVFASVAHLLNLDLDIVLRQLRGGRGRAL